MVSSRHWVCLAQFPTSIKGESVVGSLIGLSGCESRGEKGGVGLEAVSDQTSKMESDMYSLFSISLFSKQTVKT